MTKLHVTFTQGLLGVERVVRFAVDSHHLFMKFREDTFDQGMVFQAADPTLFYPYYQIHDPALDAWQQEASVFGRRIAILAVVNRTLVAGQDLLNINLAAPLAIDWAKGVGMQARAPGQTNRFGILDMKAIGSAGHWTGEVLA